MLHLCIYPVSISVKENKDIMIPAELAKPALLECKGKVIFKNNSSSFIGVCFLLIKMYIC
jgi:hypothetical protein